MILILEAIGLYFLILLFALWWMRTRGLCKLPDGRDWLWGKLSLALEGRVMLSQFSSVTQSCLTLCDPMDFSLLGSSVHGIFQTRVLEWAAISFSNSREGTQLHPSTENWIKDLLSMAPPIRTRSSFPLNESLALESFHKPLVLLHQRADWKPKSQKTNQSDHMDHSLV